jgi:hypothetical protein
LIADPFVETDVLNCCAIYAGFILLDYAQELVMSPELFMTETAETSVSLARD